MRTEEGSLGQRAHTAFVGRERELAVLCARLADAISGRGHLLMLVGEPGIGKTRLAEELARHAQAEGVAVRWGSCWDGEGAPAFWPWIQVLRAHVLDTDPAVLRAQLGSGGGHVARIVPEVLERLPDVPAPPALGPEEARFRLFDAVASFLRTASMRQSLVLVLEDLQWADEPSLSLLRFLSRDVGSAAMVLVGTYRDVEVDPTHPLSEALGEVRCHQQFDRILLDGLSTHDVQRYLELALGPAPPTHLAARVHRQTDGNPLFVGELVRLLAGDAELLMAAARDDSTFVVPESVRDVVRRRLKRLSGECNRVLTIAAVMGSEFRLNVLESLAGLPADCLLEVLSEAALSRVIRQSPEVVGQYRFAHALIREVLYEDLSLAGRARLHDQVGRALENLYSANAQLHSAEIAHHFVHAAPRGAVDKAIDWSARAAERAAALLAYEDAIAHYQRALHVLRHWRPGERERECTLLLGRGEAQAMAGTNAARKESFQRAAELARDVRAPELLARAAIGFAPVLDVVEVPAGPHVPLIEEALAALGEGDSALRARLLALLSLALYWSPDQARRARRSGEAVAVARRVGDSTALAYALLARLGTLGAAEDAVTKEMMQVAEHAGAREVVLWGCGWQILETLKRGDFATADRRLEAFGRHAQEARQPYFVWWHTTLRVMRAQVAGQFESAEKLAQQALSLGQEALGPQALMSFFAQTYHLSWERGRLEEMAPMVESLADESANIPIVQCVRCLFHAEVGRSEQARAELQGLATHDFAAVPRNADWLNCMAALSRACSMLGDTHHATTLYELLKAHRRRIILAGVGALCTGSTSLQLGTLATTLGRWEEASAHFGDALEMHSRIGSRPWIAHTQYEYAAMLLARDEPGDRRQASDLLAEVLGIADELGMVHRREQALALQRKVAEGTARIVEPLTDAATEAAYGVAADSAKSGLGGADHLGLLRLEGDYWTVAYDGTMVRLKDSVGLRYLHELLRSPGREFLVSDLVARVRGVDAPAAVAAAPRQRGSRHTRASAARIDLGDAGALLDFQARSAYRRRLEELREDLEEARTFNDRERAEKINSEMGVIADELARAVGLHGRARRAGSHVERARVNATRAIRAAIRKISGNHPALGRYLFTTVRTGTFCSYAPDPRIPVVWKL